MLRVTGVTKRFGGLTALSRIDLNVQEGEIVGVMGPNGAGKTTLFNLITGFLRPTEGRIEFAGREITDLRSFQIARLGVVRTFQNIQLFGRMSVVENLAVAQHHLVPSGFRLPFRSKWNRALDDQADEILNLVGLAAERDMLAQNLPYGAQRRLELARVLATEPRLLLLDEPAAGLNPQETQALVELIARIRQLGKTVVVIEHDMNVMMTLPDRLAVLNFGEKIVEGTPAEIQSNSLVIEAYLGKGYGGD